MDPPQFFLEAKILKILYQTTINSSCCASTMLCLELHLGFTDKHLTASPQRDVSYQYLQIVECICQWRHGSLRTDQRHWKLVLQVRKIFVDVNLYYMQNLIIIALPRSKQHKIMWPSRWKLTIWHVDCQHF